MARPRGLKKVGEEELKTLEDGGIVDGWIINAFFRLIERRCNFFPLMLSVFCFDTEFLPAWKRGGFLTTKKRAMGFGIFDKELLFFPVHLSQVEPNGHWALIVVRPQTKKIQAYDPIGFRRMAEMKIIESFLIELAKEEGLAKCQDGWELEETPLNCPKQQDNVSCGVFVCVFGDKLAYDTRLLGLNLNPLESRKYIAGKLRAGRFSSEFFEEETQQRIASSSPMEIIDISSPEEPTLMEELEQYVAEYPIPPPQEDSLIKELDELIIECSNNIDWNIPEVEDKVAAEPMVEETVESRDEPIKIYQADQDRSSPVLILNASDEEEEPPLQGSDGPSGVVPSTSSAGGSGCKNPVKPPRRSVKRPSTSQKVHKHQREPVSVRHQRERDEVVNPVTRRQSRRGEMEATVIESRCP